ncbi:MAG: helix-turn-helix transcriptional regulator [Candidatus Marinimicrobia bacterium]|nr:helix-turn-helix transcriptional regulator [Candidatus Neomarinimicrobiota bacterium]
MLGNLPRLRILYVLSKTGQCCVHQLAEILDMNISNVSHNLRKMHDRRIVKKKRDGLNIYYTISHDKGLSKACKIAGELLGIASES